ncbi:MAG: 2OG-Fe(II) oxygenase [Chlamydiota bacterium]
MLHYLLGVYWLIILQTVIFASPTEQPIHLFGFQQIAKSPQIYECENFLSDDECEYIISQAKPRLERSTMVDPNSSGVLINKDRTSLGVFLSHIGDPILQKIRERIELVTEIPEENGESMQVLYYNIGAEYKPHYDFFDPQTPGGLIHYNRGGQRVASFLLYLNTPDKGGETVFPRAGLKIQAKKGKAVVFYNVDNNGNTNPMSLHGGSPVIAGEKWIATIWLRESIFE